MKRFCLSKIDEKTTRNYYVSNESKIFFVGWGFCSEECFHDSTEPFYGKAREKLVDVLNDDYCETELTQNGTLNFVHKPEVLCVGYNHSYNIRVYIKNSQGKLYKHVPRNNDRYKNLVSVEDMWYIVGKSYIFY